MNILAPSTGISFRNIHELRLFFAASVVVSHAVQLAGYREWDVLRVIFSSEIAVQGFFILSGFLVYGSYERMPRLMPYLRRRVARIFPAYAIAVLLFLTLVLAQQAWLGLPLPPAEAVLRYLAANLALANFLQPGLPGVFPGNLYQALNGALWTIKVEMMFYLLVPLLYLSARRIGLGALVVAMLLTGLLWGPFMDAADVWGAPIHPSFAHQLPGQLQFFGFGVLLFGIATGRIGPARAVALAAGPVVLGIVLDQGETVANMAGLLSVILIATRLPEVNHWLKRRDLSYGIYLAHFPMIQMAIVGEALPSNGLVFAGAALLAACIYGLASWHLVEAPIIRAGRAASRTGVARP